MLDNTGYSPYDSWYYDQSQADPATIDPDNTNWYGDGESSMAQSGMGYFVSSPCRYAVPEDSFAHSFLVGHVEPFSNSQ